LAWTRSEIFPSRGKGAEGATWSQDQRASLDGGPGEPVGQTSRATTPWKARGSRISRALTLLWKLRVLAPLPGCDGFRRPSRRGSGATARARDAVPTRAPPADGRRECAASGSAKSGAMPREGPASRLQGRKTLASLSGQATARTAAPRRETDGERRRHTTPQARVGDGFGRRDRER
jgi:hypothetical protein